MRGLVLLVFFLVTSCVAYAQHGSAPNGYYPSSYAGDTWTGNFTSADDARGEITIVYSGKKKTETFLGVLPMGFKIKLKDGSSAELKPSKIRIGTKITVYYIHKDRVLNGKKEKINEIFRLDFISPNSN